MTAGTGRDTVSLADIDAMLTRAGLGDRIVRARTRGPAAAFTAASQRDAAAAREKARRTRAEWLLKLSVGDTTPAGVIRAACTPELTSHLRRLRLDHIMRAHEHARNMTGIHARLALVHARSGAPGQWCDTPHTRTSPKSACAGFHPSQMTIAWLLNPSTRGRRFRAWAGLHATVWEGYPRRPHGRQ